MNPNEPLPSRSSDSGMPPFTEVSPPRTRDPGGAKLMMTWLALIVATLALFIPANFHATPTSAPTVEQTESWSLRFLSRYAIGVHEFYRSTGPAQPAKTHTITTSPLGQSSTTTSTTITATTSSDAVSEPMLRMIRESVDDRKINPADPAAKRELDVDRLRATVVVAELSGIEPALERLDAYAAEPSFDQELLPDIAAFRTVYEKGPDAVDPDARKLLTERHNWFGELALTFGKDASDPARAAAIGPCTRTLVALAVAGCIAGLALLTGFVLFIIAIVLLTTGKLQRRFQRNIGLSEKENRVLLEVPVVLMAGLVGIHLLINWFASHPSPDVQQYAAIGMPLQLGLAVVVFWPLVRGYRFTRLRQAYGWHFGQGFFREVFSGLSAYFAGLPVVLVGFVMTFTLLAIQAAITGESVAPSHPVVEGAGSGGIGHALLLYALASGWAPIVEEAAFRAAFFRHLRWWMGPVGSGVIVGIFFAAVHPQGWAFIPALASLGLVFALIREWRGSLIGSMTAHAVHNAFLITMILLILT